MDECEEIVRMRQALEWHTRPKLCSDRRMAFQELSPLSTKIAYVLDFSDVCKIESKYLEMWSKHQEHAYITAQDLLKSLNMTYLSIFKKFFSIYSETVVFNIFFNFIYVFTFCPFDKLIKSIFLILALVLLSSYGINANIRITMAQCVKFIKGFYFGEICDELVLEWMKSKGSNFVTVDEIFTLSETCSYFHQPIKCIKKQIIEYILGYDLFANIMKRKKFFDSKSCSLTDFVPVSNEVCVNCCLFKKKENNMHSDYRELVENNKNNDIVESSIKYTTDIIVFEIRKRYGYSLRNNISSSYNQYTDSYSFHPPLLLSVCMKSKSKLSVLKSTQSTKAKSVQSTFIPVISNLNPHSTSSY